SESAGRVRSGLESKGIDLNSAQAAVIFSQDSPPGAELRFTITSRTTCAIAAIGTQMSVAGDTLPPTDLEVFIYRATPHEEDEIELPDPLADPRLDF
ncbi:MAG TPA: aminomethyltransferase, partial [Deltaproteobacteria bacterium]|nr:aminomethyltransferase [Deltaproteobacteria bacterium]